jgi:hypothetical protein
MTVTKTVLKVNVFDLSSASLKWKPEKLQDMLGKIASKNLINTQPFTESFRYAIGLQKKHLKNKKTQQKQTDRPLL